MRIPTKSLTSLFAIAFLSTISQTAYAREFMSKSQFDYFLNCQDSLGRYMASALIGAEKFAIDLQGNFLAFVEDYPDISRLMTTHEQDVAINKYYDDNMEGWVNFERGFAAVATRPAYSNRINSLRAEAVTCLTNFPIENGQ